MHSACGCASQTPQVNSISHAKLAAPEWALIQVKFDPIQEIGSKVGGGRSFEGGCSFTRLWDLSLACNNA